MTPPPEPGCWTVSAIDERRVHATDGQIPEAYNGAYVELHCRSGFSFLRAGSSVEALVARAAALGMPALALTDHMTLAGVVRFQAACAEYGIRPIVGVELAVADPAFGDRAAPAHLIVLAEDTTGYARLCRLLTDANLANPEAPVVPFAALADEPAGLIVLTGGHEGVLVRSLLAGRWQVALDAARRYAAAFGPDRAYVEIQHHLLPDGTALPRQLVGLAAETGLRCVATNGVRHTTREDYPVYDLLTCVRLGITVDEPHAERPRNDEAYLKSGDEIASLFASFPSGSDALAASAEIAARCTLSLLKSTCTAPSIALPAAQTPATHLRALCATGLATRYAQTPDALAPESAQRRQLAHELDVISALELEEFFLCVADIVRAARAMGIRVSGRGSAANSIVAYLLGITGVDPSHHRLLFERFLNPDRRGMPDIDLDVQSDRREELIRYVERTYTERHAAMVANVITYRPRLALRDAAKALGYPLDLVNRLTKILPHHCPRRDIPRYRDELAGVIATFPSSLSSPSPSATVLDTATRERCLARLPLLLELAPRLCGLPRHLSLHNGGMVLSREPLAHLLPVRVSANGVRALEIDKDDAERLGLIKFDILGLRTLGAIEEALALIEETTGERPNLDALPTDPPDGQTMRLVRAGQTLAVFQIESPGQWHLLAQTQPQTFDDLIIETALFRPGPLQGGFIRPYVERRTQQTHEPEQQGEQGQRRHQRQRDAVQTPWHGAPADDFWTAHPVLGLILRDTEGILLFQEQVLEIAHQYAGLSLGEADGFRRAMSHARDPEEMAAMHDRFLAGALARGEPAEDAERVFAAVSAYTGYGFCRSHAAEFARTIYQTAWLKAHHPAHYLAGFLSAQPAGYFPPHVVLEEAKLLGIPVLGPDINRSEDRFTVERVGSAGHERWAIRIGLRQIAGVGDELAEAILWERRWHGAESRPSDEPGHPFTSLADACHRLRGAGLTLPTAEALVRAGACDGLRPAMDRRRRLWHLHELWSLVGAVPAHARGRGQKRGRRWGRGKGRDAEQAEQMVIEWEIAPDPPNDIPALPAFDREERTALDYQFLGLSPRPHPMHLLRRDLRRRGVHAIADLAGMPEGRMVRVAGWAISAQRPPTANGMGFVVLEDETGRLPVALPPRLAEQMHRVIRDARVVAVTGRVERVRWYCSLLGYRWESIA